MLQTREAKILNEKEIQNKAPETESSGLKYSDHPQPEMLRAIGYNTS